MINVLLDTRETKLIDYLKERELDKYSGKITFDVKPLDIGDIHICFNDKVFILERKTIRDLLSSIKDGRYKEQKARLLASGCDISYVIEGDDIISSYDEKNRHILSSIYINTLYRDKIKIIFTKNIMDTTTFILTFCTKIIDNPHKFIDVLNKQNEEYVDVVKMKTKKNENITPEVCYLMQLAQIPSISSKIAKNIQKSYPTMKELLTSLQKSKDKINLLCKIDNIGKEKASKILQYLSFT